MIDELEKALSLFNVSLEVADLEINKNAKTVCIRKML